MEHAPIGCVTSIEKENSKQDGQKKFIGYRWLLIAFGKIGYELFIGPLAIKTLPIGTNKSI